MLLCSQDVNCRHRSWRCRLVRQIAHGTRTIAGALDFYQATATRQVGAAPEAVRVGKKLLRVKTLLSCESPSARVEPILSAVADLPMLLKEFLGHDVPQQALSRSMGDQEPKHPLQSASDASLFPLLSACDQPSCTVMRFRAHWLSAIA